jgi:GNAT superfamily N-acetyltransferase
VTELDAQRTAIRPLLAPSDPQDALTAYYALYHDPRRVQLVLHHTSSGEARPEPWVLEHCTGLSSTVPQDQGDQGLRINAARGQSRGVDGFLAVCQTGHDLFRPLVVIRAPDDAAAGDLFRQTLAPGRPYYVIAPLELAQALERFLSMPKPAVNRIYRVDPARFQLAQTTKINVLLQEKRDPGGQPRWEIRSGDKVAAAAGANWRSPFCAEVYVYTRPEFQRRGWGRAVLQAATAGLLREGLLPLYTVEEANLPSIRLAEAAGYTDTGRREVAGEIHLLG